MRQPSLKAFLGFILGFTLITGCGDGSSSGGGGTANPLTGKSVTISTAGTDFNNVFLSSSLVAVSKSTEVAGLVTKDVAVLDTQTVNYTFSNSTGLIEYDATFADGTLLDVSLTLNSSGSITSGTVKIDGVVVTSNFTVGAPTNAGTAADALAAGLAAFISHDLVTARDSFCNELPDEPANSSLAFGCFWAKSMLLPTTSDAATLLAAFDEGPFSIANSYYGSGGVFFDLGAIHRGFDDFFPQFNYLDFDLPFADFINANSALGLKGKFGKLLQAAVDNGVSAEEIQTRIDGLLPHLSELEALISIVLADSGFSFTLPKELFNHTSDIDVTPNDAALLASGVEGSIVGVDIANAYDFGVDIDKVVSGGVIDDEIFVEDLNGSGATVGSVTVDTVSFLTLADAARITSSKSRFLAACSLAKGGLTTLAGGATSELFANAFDPTGLTDVITTLTELINSANSGATLLSALPSSHPVTLNLNEFFLTPPDAATVPLAAGDPFVLDIDGTHAVESYFEALATGVATF